MKVSTDAILYIIGNLQKQGLADFQTENLKRVEILDDYLFPKNKIFGQEIINIAKEKNGKIAVLVLEFDRKPELPTNLFIDNFQNYQRDGRIVLVKLFSGMLTATTKKVTIDNDSSIHPVTETDEKDYIIDLLFEKGELTAYYYDKSNEQVHKFKASTFGIM